MIKWNLNGENWWMQARDAAVAMPLRVQRVDEVMRQLEAGDLKLRVRVLEVRNLSTSFLVNISPVKAQLNRASPDSQTTSPTY